MMTKQPIWIVRLSHAVLVLLIGAWAPAGVAQVTATLTAGVHLRAGPDMPAAEHEAAPREPAAFRQQTTRHQTATGQSAAPGHPPDELGSVIVAACERAECVSTESSARAADPG
jgi:hypothetical protein